MLKTLSSIIFPLITFPYVSRVLMPDNIGKINFGASFVSYFTLIASLGITTYAIRECSAKRENKIELTKTSSQIFSINVCTTIVAYVLMILTLCFFRDFDSYRTLIIIQSTAILFSTLGCDWINIAMEDFAFITVRTIALQLVSIMLMFLFVHNQNDYIKYAFITILSSSGANVINIFYRKKYCIVRFVTDMEWKRHFKPIFLLFVMILAQTIFSNADITMIGLIKGDAEVGLYSTALKIEYIIAQIVSSLAWVVMPRMSSYFEEGDYCKINKLLEKVFGILIFIGVPCIVGTISLSNEIVLVVGGKQYLGSAIPLTILMISFGFSLLGGSFLGNMVLLPSKKEKNYMIICCVATVLNIVLNLFLIPLWGAIAAAGTTAFCSLLMMLLMVVTRDRKIKLNYIGKSLLSPIVGSIFIFIYCKVIVSNVSSLILKIAISITGSILIYVLISLMLKNEVQYQFIDKIMARIRGSKKC